MLKNDSFIVKCSHCKKILSAESFEEHKCDLPITDVKRIPVVYFQDDSYANKKLMTGWGIDGVIYTFEVVPREAIPCIMPLSDDSYHEPSNRRKVTRTGFNLYIRGSRLYRARGKAYENSDTKLKARINRKRFLV